MCLNIWVSHLLQFYIFYYNSKKKYLSIFLSRYFIDYNAEDDRFFNIDANTGSIKTTKVLDREETPWYNITVAASENGKWLDSMYDRKICHHTWRFILRFPHKQVSYHFYLWCQNLRECTECIGYNFTHFQTQWIQHICSPLP